jgi:dUTPase
MLLKIFNNVFSKKKNYIEKGSSYAVLRGDYYGEIFVFFYQEDDTLFFVSLPKMEIRKVNVVKFNIGVKDKILDFVNIVPKKIYKVIECHGKNSISGK